MSISPEISLLLAVAADVLWVVLGVQVYRLSKQAAHDNWQPVLLRFCGALIAAVLVQTTLRALVPYGLPLGWAELGSLVLRGMLVLVAVTAIWSSRHLNRDEDEDRE